MRIGFIGLGIMGRPMAFNLLKAGFDLTVWARREIACEPLCAAGAKRAESAAQLATGVDLVISMVADAPDVTEVMLGRNGVVEGARPGLVTVDMSTIAPAAARGIGASLRQRGVGFVDAPVSGGESGAIAGTLSIMAGGTAEDVAFAYPALSAMGRNIVHVGESGCGQVAKAANQIMTGIGVVAVAEALTFARKNGADPAKVREAMLGGSACSRILENHGQRMLDRNFAPGFKAWMHQKDMNIVLQAAHEAGVALPVSAAAAQLLNAVAASGLAEEDSIAVLKILEALAGLSRIQG